MTRNFQGADLMEKALPRLLPGNRIQLHDWQGERRDGGSNPPWSVFLRLQKWMDQGEKPPKYGQPPPKYGQWPPKYGQSVKFAKS